MQNKIYRCRLSCACLLLGVFLASSNANAGNSLVNGSFESGLSPWTASVGTASVVTNRGASHGTRALVLVPGDVYYFETVSQSFPTKVGDKYILHCDVGSYGTNQNILVGAQYKVWGDNTPFPEWLAGGFALGVPSIPATFKHITESFIADSTNTTIMFENMSMSEEGGDVLIDNVIITPVKALEIIRSGTKSIVQWLKENGATGLQRSPTPAISNSWEAVPKLPVLNDGYYQVTNSLGGPQMFYRLQVQNP